MGQLVTLWVSLHTATPPDLDNEVTGAGYARSLERKGGATFPTATEDWGTVESWVLWSAAEGGMVIASGTLGGPVRVSRLYRLKRWLGKLRAWAAWDCITCERCTWAPGPDCGRPDHPHCTRCGHCRSRHHSTR